MKARKQTRLQLRQPVHQARVVFFFIVQHTFVFVLAVVWWKWWGIPLGFFVNCFLDAIVLLAWFRKSKLTN
jgi:hypothetical protein